MLLKVKWIKRPMWMHKIGFAESAAYPRCQCRGQHKYAMQTHDIETTQVLFQPRVKLGGIEVFLRPIATHAMTREAKIDILQIAHTVTRSERSHRFDWLPRFSQKPACV